MAFTISQADCIKQVEFTPIEASPDGLVSVLSLRRLLFVECLSANEHGLGIMVSTRDTDEALGWPANTPGTLAVLIEKDGDIHRHEIGRVKLLTCIPTQAAKGFLVARLLFAMPIA